MARAKRTQRAEARRRYRAATEPEVEVEGEASLDTRGPSRGSGPSARPDGRARVGILDALRISIHPPRFREDLALLPSLLTNRALWLPVVVILATAVITAITRGADLVTSFLFTYFLVTPAIGGVFLAGFLAPRASWLIGIVVSLVSAICYILMGAAGLLPGTYGEQFAKFPFEASVSTLVSAPVLGAFFASAAAWYRRFLRLSNPNRARQAQAPRRANDGRTRGSNDSQKAGARR